MDKINKIFLKTIILFFALALLVFSCAFSKNEEANVRMEVMYPGGVKVAEPGQPLPVNVCFDLLRNEKNYSAPFNYEISLVCNERKVAEDKGRYVPPEGVAIKRTTICKTFKFTPGDFIKPQTSAISLKAYIDIQEAGRVRIQRESKTVEMTLKAEYSQVTVSGRIICTSEIPLSLAQVEILGKMPESKLVSPYSNVTVFTDEKGSFTAVLPSPPTSGLEVIAKLYCPGEKYPSMTISGKVAGNACSFGTINLQCQKCGGALSLGEEEQLK